MFKGITRVSCILRDGIDHLLETDTPCSSSGCADHETGLGQRSSDFARLSKCLWNQSIERNTRADPNQVITTLRHRNKGIGGRIRAQIDDGKSTIAKQVRQQCTRQRMRVTCKDTKHNRALPVLRHRPLCRN